MRVFALRAAVAAIVAATALALAPAAGADTGQSTTRAGDNTKVEVDALIADNPGAKRVAHNKVILANGVQAIYTPSGQSGSGSAGGVSVSGFVYKGCDYYYLCIWDEYRNKWSFYNCGQVNIGNHGWSDKVRDVTNNQAGATSYFYDWKGYWDFLSSIPPQFGTGYLPPSDPLRQTDMINVC
ncbi:hypothetical protein [Actinokineospora iranica]|uniref:Peptidase inhibitor family I36 n=1 Tax=Actinokineospora iranica TaxID=1271860 RepID=A0A1G6R3I8_9PSEU|nr:hypothetical protein [Actinokineospora iranica]SDC98963.1 hypothetical protein SAMN05216174_106113 [Actinokineospora iranica]